LIAQGLSLVLVAAKVGYSVFSKGFVIGYHIQDIILILERTFGFLTNEA
jgi:hypothetical protein